MLYVQDFFLNFRRVYRPPASRDIHLPPPSPRISKIPEANTPIVPHRPDDLYPDDREDNPEEDEEDVLKCIYSRTVAKLLYTGVTGCLGKAIAVQHIPDHQYIEALLGIQSSDDSKVSMMRSILIIPDCPAEILFPLYLRSRIKLTHRLSNGAVG